MAEHSESHDEQLPADLDRRIAEVEAYIASASSQPTKPQPSGVIVHLSPWFWSGMGVILGIVVVVLWTVTFQPHGGPELSAYLFPGSRWLLLRLYPHESVPVIVWYGSAFLHWPIIGAAIDIVRLIIRHANTRNA